MSNHVRSRPLFRRHKEPRWPPYGLVEQSIQATAERKLERLERLYHVGQESAWDGQKVLTALIDKHGPPRLPPDHQAHALRLLSVLLWGELAAWAISADLAERIDDVEAKMAATSQAHDEARHFYVLRDYLRALGQPVPRLGGLARQLLVGILETDSLVHKLIGMQLLVESNALSIFRGLSEAGIEPVLQEILPYYEKDESRHVGLGVLYLPRLLARLSTAEVVGVAAFQLRCFGLLMSAGLLFSDSFAALGMDQRQMAKHTMRLQEQILGDMLAASGRRREAVQGLVNPGRGVGPALLDFLHPKGDIGPLHRSALAAWTATARLVDRALA
jgi:hypothetical protein